MGEPPLRFEIRPYADRAGRARFAVERFGAHLQGGVLDVGCGPNALHGHLPGPVTGLDRQEPADVRCDLEAGIPFPDRSFDAVVCLEVLEHLDAFHATARELFRVARSTVLVSLPNSYELSARLAILRGGKGGRPPLSRYGLPPAPPPDRHRWFFAASEGAVAVDGIAAATGWRREEGFGLVPCGSVATAAIKRLLALPPGGRLDRLAESVWMLYRPENLGAGG